MPNNQILATVHNDYIPFISLASDEELAQFVRAQICHAMGEEVPELSGMSKALYEAHINLSVRLEESRRRKSEAGKRGTQVSESQIHQCQAEVEQCQAEVEQCSAEPQPNTITNTVTNKPPKSPNGDDDRFNRFWLEYPKKAGKKDAIKAWNKLKPPDELVEAIISAVKRQRASPQWARDGGQYIPNPATFLNGRRWEDEAAPQNPVSGNFWGGVPDG